MKIKVFAKDKEVKFFTIILTGTGEGGRWITFQWKPRFAIWGYWVNRNFFL